MRRNIDSIGDTLTLTAGKYPDRTAIINYGGSSLTYREFNERVNRRYKELAGLKQDITPEGVSKDLNNRDTIDSTRSYAPLKRAADAIYIDTTNMSIDQVVQEMFNHIDKKRNG